MTIARVGEPAPEFSLPVFDPAAPDDIERIATLQSYAGRWLVLFFYPMDFTFVCPTEILALSDRIEEFHTAGASVLGCSTDTIYTHRAWFDTPRDKNGIAGTRCPLAADHAGVVARRYGVLIEALHVALRGLFIIDPAGLLQYEVVHALNVGRSTDETLRVLAALQQGGLCPADWRPGAPGLSSTRRAA